MVLVASLVIAHSSKSNTKSVVEPIELGCSFCDPGSTAPSVSIKKVMTVDQRCCIDFEGPPNTFFQVAYTCSGSGFLCERTTDGSGNARCCYPGIAPCSEIAIVTSPNGCECQTTPSCS